MLTIYLTCLTSFLLPICLLITNSLYKIYKQFYININIFNNNINNTINLSNILSLSIIYIEQNKWLSSILIIESNIIYYNELTEKFYNSIGFCYYQIKAYDLSKYYYIKAIKKEPEYISALYNLYQLYKIINDNNNANDIHKKIIEIQKNSNNIKESVNVIINTHDRDSRI